MFRNNSCYKKGITWVNCLQAQTQTKNVLYHMDYVFLCNSLRNIQNERDLV